MKCLIVSNVTMPPDGMNKINSADSPRKDYLLLAEQLGAEIIASSPNGKKGFARKGGIFVEQAWEAFRRRNEYDIVLTMSEQVGLLLALLFKIARCEKPHVMISHYMTPAKKRMFTKLLGVDSHITRFVCYGSVQAAYLHDELGIPSEKIELVLHPADSEFWKPLPVPTEKIIVSAGLLARDYESLIKAVDGLDVEVVIAANSPWMGGEKKHTSNPVPKNVRFVKCAPSELRELYAKAMFVAVPLYPVNIQAGSLVIYESMAMGKAVVTTSNGGNVDIVRHGETGYYVPSQDPQALRETIVRLLDNPAEAIRLGARAREIVEDGLNMDVYAQGVVRVVKETYERSMALVG